MRPKISKNFWSAKRPSSKVKILIFLAGAYLIQSTLAASNCGILIKRKSRPLHSIFLKMSSSVVFPGQDISNLIEEKLQNSDNLRKIQLGPGIIQNGSEILPLRTGILQNSKLGGTKFILNAHQTRYVPLQNDLVIGIVTARLSEFFRVDIGSQSTAVLSVLNGFEGATKKNRPNWNVGTVIFARVAMAHPDLEPELACFDPSGNVSIDLFGELGATETSPLSSESGRNAEKKTKTSMLLRTSCNFSRRLQNPMKDPLISLLGRYFAFEIASGANGRIFIEAGTARETVAIYNLILDAYNDDKFSNDKDVEERIKDLARKQTNK